MFVFLYITLFLCVGFDAFEVNFTFPGVQSLYDLYGATNGEEWYCCFPFNSVEWDFRNPTVNPCVSAWQGIRCNELNTTITAVELESRGVTGTLPDSVGDLLDLESFNLGNLVHNKFVTGPSNQLSGTIPFSVGKLTKLEKLSFYEGRLTGTVPSSVGNLTNLELFYVDTNHLTGTIPSEIGNFNKVAYLGLQSNSFTGTIPHGMYKLTNLIYLGLNKNLLNGTISNALGDLTKLEQLYLYSNKLNGTFPSTVGKLVKLKVVISSSNYLTGPIPDSFGNLTKLSGLYLFSNSLTGTIPSSIGKISSLRYVDVMLCSLTGPIPKSLGGLALLNTLYASYNMLSGPLPDFNSSLSELYVESNYLTGTIPSSYASLSKMQQFIVNSNCLSGTIPSSFSGLSNVEYLQVAGNQLTGSIPELTAMVNLTELFVDENVLTGSLFGLFNPNEQLLLTNIQVNDNQLTGTIPSEIFEISLLSTFVAVSNCFYGTLPSTVCNATALHALVLDGLSSATSCQRVLLPDLSSSYTTTVSMSGTVPWCLLSSNSLVSFHLSGNALTGVFPENVVLGPLLDSLILSHNMLTGKIPEYIQERQWYALDLSYNRLTGTLSTKYPSQTENTTLSLENNRLSGGIPEILYDAKNISVLGTNLFECFFDGSNLPKNEKDRNSYLCGSTYFNIQYYVWLGFVGVIGGAMIVWWKCMKQVVDTSDVNDSLQQVRVWLAHTRPEDPDTNFCSFSSLALLGIFFNFILQITGYCVTFIVILFFPLYAILGVYYGTYEYAYAYNFSPVFLSGVVPFAVIFSFWVIFIFGLLGFALRTRIGKLFSVSNVKYTSKLRLSKGQIFGIAAIFVMLNLVIVGSVNIGYMYSAIYGLSSLLLLEQVLLSLFKWYWNSQCLTAVLSFAGRVVVPGQTSNANFHLQFLNLQIVMSIINNILLPLVVVMVVNPSCFYNVFVASPAVTAQYNSEVCGFQSAKGCIFYLDIESTSTYDPPFTYSYQCSSSFITYYSPTYVSLCIMTSFIVPLVKCSLAFCYQRAEPNSVWFRTLDALIPPLWKPPDASALQSSYVDSRGILVIIATFLGLLVTFGLTFPPLAVAFGLSIAVSIFSARIEIGRFLSSTADLGSKTDFKDVIVRDCDVVRNEGLVEAVSWMLIIVSFLYYTLFLFDTLGDAEGPDRSYWVLVLVPSIPLVLFLIVRGYGWWVSGVQGDGDGSDDERHTEMSTVGFPAEGITRTPPTASPNHNHTVALEETYNVM